MKTCQLLEPQSMSNTISETRNIRSQSARTTLHRVVARRSNNRPNVAESPAAQNPTRSKAYQSLGIFLSSTLLRRGKHHCTFLSYLNSPLPLLPHSSSQLLLLRPQNGHRCSFHASLCLAGPRSEAPRPRLPRCACFPLPAGNSVLLAEPSW